MYLYRMNQMILHRNLRIVVVIIAVCWNSSNNGNGITVVQAFSITPSGKALSFVSSLRRKQQLQLQRQLLPSSWFLSSSTSNDIAVEDDIVITDDASIDDTIESIIHNDVDSQKDDKKKDGETKDDANVSYSYVIVQDDTNEVVDTSNFEQYYRIESTPNGPKGGMVHTLTFPRIPGEQERQALTLTTGKIGRLAAGSIHLQRGDTVLYTTASRDVDDDSRRDRGDFIPLSVEHTERFSSAGLTSGSFHKRDGRPAEHEILTCRLIDRPIRPLIQKGWCYETQLLSWVLSYDGQKSCDPLAIIGGSAALYISDIPYTKPVAAVEVGMVEVVMDNDDNDTASASNDVDNDEETTDDNKEEKVMKEKYYKFVVNPTIEEMALSPLQLTIAGTADGILMIEGTATFVPESIFIQAIEYGFQTIQVLCQGIMAYGAHLDHSNYGSDSKTTSTTKDPLRRKEKFLATLQKPPRELQQRVDELYTEMVDAYYTMNGSKKVKGAAMNDIYMSINSNDVLPSEFPDISVSYFQSALKNLLVRRMYHTVRQTGARDDGRAATEIRDIDMDIALLPRVHGSALFTRGETQTIATVTLGDNSMKQKIDTINGMDEKRFYLQYTFPPSCVGETGRVGMPGRREIGHGNLAERAIRPIIPDVTAFPYSIRVESLITESHGSSSMASVCGGCLALMDAGVPIVSPVAGIAMGMLLVNDDKEDNNNNNRIDDTNAIILSDITGTEDALGTMDFKVAGNRVGITTFQLDIKCEGLTIGIMEKALEQARIGRIHILDKMEEVLSTPKDTLPSTVPKMISFPISPDTIGKVIGPGGKQIRAIIEDFKLANMDVSDDGTIQLTAFDGDMLSKAQEFVMTLVNSSGGRGGGGGGGMNGEKKERLKYDGPEPVEGIVYTGKITGIHQFGVFVEILPGSEDGTKPGLEGLVHVSELARERVRNCEGFMKSMDVTTLTVKYMGKDAKGKVRLSRKAVLEDQYGGNNNNKSVPPSSIPVNGAATMATGVVEAASSTDMSQDEMDVISKAIDGQL